MVSPLYSVRDEVAGIFNQPFVDANDNSVKRSFSDAVLGGKLNHPNDFAVYHVGDFNTIDGVVTPLSVPVLVIRGDQIEKE